MKNQGFIWLGLFTGILLAACAGGGSGGKMDAKKGSAAGIVQLPNRLDGNKCDLPRLNNRGEALFYCGDESVSPAKARYAIWRGGDALEPLPAPVPDSDYTIVGFSDNGSIIGNVIRVDEELHDEEGNSAGAYISMVKPFAVIDGTTQYLADYGINDIVAVSDSGEYLVFHDAAESDAPDSEALKLGFLRFPEFRKVPLASIPKNISFEFLNQISDDGTLAGICSYSDDEHAFIAHYGCLWSPANFELIAAPGRPDLSTAEDIKINNRGTAAVMFQNGDTIEAAVPGEPGTYQEPVYKQFLRFADGREVIIPAGGEKDSVYVGSFNDNNIAVGGTENDSTGVGFIFSERSGLHVVSDILPPEAEQLGDLSNVGIAELNDRNQAILSAPCPGEEDSSCYYLFQLPDDF